MTQVEQSSKVRHILSISGGKDSAALAVYLRERIPDLEYVFCDTQKELPETYDYLARLEAYLGKPIVYLQHDGRGFDHWLKVFGGYLPSAQMRWCTKHLKLKPFERYVGDSPVINYVGLREDEDRDGYISRKPNITARYPFREEGIVYSDVISILNEVGLGLPDYYRWRSRSGCYFCFFQQKIEWVGLLENYPHLYRLARAYETADPKTGTLFTWNDNESLEAIAQPQRICEIKLENKNRMARTNSNGTGRLCNIFNGDPACLICTL